jgi:hypothetical protein
VGKFLIVAGLVLLGVGLVLHFGPSLPLLGKLPGDFRIERPGFRLYLPLGSCLLLSVVLTLLLQLFSRLR